MIVETAMTIVAHRNAGWVSVPMGAFGVPEGEANGASRGGLPREKDIQEKAPWLDPR